MKKKFLKFLQYCNELNQTVKVFKEENVGSSIIITTGEQAYCLNGTSQKHTSLNFLRYKDRRKISKLNLALLTPTAVAAQQYSLRTCHQVHTC